MPIHSGPSARSGSRSASAKRSRATLSAPSITIASVETPAVRWATRFSSMTLGLFSGSSASKPVRRSRLRARIMAGIGHRHGEEEKHQRAPDLHVDDRVDRAGKRMFRHRGQFRHDGGRCRDESCLSRASRWCFARSCARWSCRQARRAGPRRLFVEDRQHEGGADERQQPDQAQLQTLLFGCRTAVSFDPKSGEHLKTESCDEQGDGCERSDID